MPSIFWFAVLFGGYLVVSDDIIIGDRVLDDIIFVYEPDVNIIFCGRSIYAKSPIVASHSNVIFVGAGGTLVLILVVSL